MAANILVASQNPSTSELTQRLLRELSDAEVLVAASFPEAHALLTQNNVGVIFLDVQCPGAVPYAEQLMSWLASWQHQPPRLAAISEGSYPREFLPLADDWVEHHLVTPLQTEQLAEVLQSARQESASRNDRPLQSKILRAGDLKFVTRTPELFQMLDQLAQVASHDVTMLLIGETGTGKTYLANIVHVLSQRRRQRFVTTACGALPPDLIESELFGHVRGAFTSAERAKKGRFEAAAHGTLLLDEIDVLGPKEQAKLLRIIETGDYEPVGSSETKNTNVRLIVASNVDLKELTERNQFRADLYWRLNVLEFRLLPLRQRPYDVVPLALQFIEESSRELGISIERAEVDFLKQLKCYPWPGNVRELRNQMRRAVLFSVDGTLRADSLSLASNNHEETSGERNGSAKPLPPNGWTLDGWMAQSEKELLERALQAHNNNRSATARALGISRVGLYKKLRRFGLLSSKTESDNHEENELMPHSAQQLDDEFLNANKSR